MSRHHRRLDGWRWAQVRRAVLARDAGLCQIRNPEVCTGTATDVDHVIPLAQGGHPYDLANARAACRPCNQARNRKLPAVDATWRL